jgi:hypothetical protein
MNERRHIRRARTLRSGKILLNNKSSVIDCTVRNLSADGACLRVASVAGIPPSFDLLIDGDNASLACDVIWRSPDHVGVSFHRMQSEPQIMDEHERDGKPMMMQPSTKRGPEPHVGSDLVRGELLALRAALATFRLVLPCSTKNSAPSFSTEPSEKCGGCPMQRRTAGHRLLH